MSQTLLDYSSWSFQLVMVLVILYLVVGLIRPSWGLATKRSTIVIVFVVISLLASTGFWIALQPYDDAPAGPAAFNEQSAPGGQVE